MLCSIAALPFGFGKNQMAYFYLPAIRSSTGKRCGIFWSQGILINDHAAFKQITEARLRELRIPRIFEQGR
jgi:hypothetical protein